MLLMLMDLADTPEEKHKIELLYGKYHQLMYVVAYRILQNQEDAEDAELQAWEKIIQNIDKIFEIDCQETKSFIVIIVERVSIDLYRKNKRRYQRELLTDEYEESPVYATKDKEMEQIELYEMIRKIPKKYSDILFLHYIHGMTGKEIGRLLNIKEASVMQRLHRARKMLKKELE